MDYPKSEGRHARALLFFTCDDRSYGLCNEMSKVIVRAFPSFLSTSQKNNTRCHCTILFPIFYSITIWSTLSTSISLPIVIELALACPLGGARVLDGVPRDEEPRSLSTDIIARLNDLKGGERNQI